MANNDKLLMYGAIAAGAYFLLGKKTTTTTTVDPSTGLAVTNTGGLPTNIPTPPSGFSQSYYLQYVYPVMLKANPNIAQPNYQLTVAELARYGANYIDIQQWVNAPIRGNNGRIVPDQYPTTEASNQAHWTKVGCAQKRTFLPLWTPDPSPYVEGSLNDNNKTGSGGGGWFSTALSIAGTVVGLLGVEPDELTADDIILLTTANAVIKDILPMYAASQPVLVGKISGAINELLAQYI